MGIAKFFYPDTNALLNKKKEQLLGRVKDLKKRLEVLENAKSTT